MAAAPGGRPRWQDGWPCPDPQARAIEAIVLVAAYIGFDPMSDSLHLGNLLMTCTLRRQQEAGHRVIALAGGGTGMVGDPGGRSDERSLLSREELGHDPARIELQLSRFVDQRVLRPLRTFSRISGAWACHWNGLGLTLR